MDDIFTHFKVGLSQHLEKQGSSLEEFEDLLSKNDTQGVATKLAGIIGDIGSLGEKLVGTGGKLLVEAPQAALALSLLAGTLGGGALYGMDNHIQNQDKRIADKKNEVSRMQGITQRLKSDYQL